MTLRDALLLVCAPPGLLFAIGLGYAAHGPLPVRPATVWPETATNVATLLPTPSARSIPTARHVWTPEPVAKNDPTVRYGAEWPSVEDVPFEWDQAVPLCHYPEGDAASNIRRDPTFTYQTGVVARLHTEQHALDYIDHSRLDYVRGCDVEVVIDDDDDDEDPWANLFRL